MNTRFLETLVWLNRLGSFRRTAEKLNTTQPAISTRMSQLEKLLGTQLYHRGERQFDLTPAGRQILQHAEDIVTLTAQLQQLVRDADQIDRPVSIGVIEMVTQSWLSLLIQEVRSTMPVAKLYIGTGTSQQLIQDLREDRMDMIFVIGPLEEPNVSVRPICTMEQEWSANPTVFDCENEVDVVQLCQLPIVLPRAGTSSYQMMVEYFKTYGILNMPSRERHLTIDCAYSLVSAIPIIRAGLAVMPLPAFLLTDDFTGAGISRMPVRQRLPSCSIVAAWKSSKDNRTLQNILGISVEAAGAFDGGPAPTR